MEQNKFLRYCPNCKHYNKSSGVCSYINSNVLEDPNEFIKYCNGEYISLINGKKIQPLKERDAAIDEDELLLVSVFSSNNNALFQVAKSILDDNRIEYLSNGDYLNRLEAPVYSAEIKVFEKDEKTARELLSELEPNQYQPSSEFEKKALSLRWYWNLAILILFIILLISIVLLLKG